MKKHVLSVMIVWLAVVGLSLYWNVVAKKKEHEEISYETARAFFQQIVTTRAWNAMHGGVYVVVTDETPPNPFLDDPLRDLTAENGIKLTKINPSYMTRQIAELAASQRGVQFHITSLNPIRPQNRPSAWEKAWLASFAQGTMEQGAFIYSGSHAVFRYMAPLIVKKPCLQCHAEQGYKEGDIRGGISITLPFYSRDVYRALLTGYGIAATAGLLLILVGGAILERNRRLLILTNDNLKAEIIERRNVEALTRAQNIELKKALSQVKKLSGFLPICASCKKIRDDKGYWKQVETYITEHSEAELSHGLCPACREKLYQDLAGDG
jgi:hypothetical protein